jgi:hypothetical protein|tara:strand:+ start:137 stop:463 length:327 start_codon:yes stop_codon:yes gene_type:complete
MAFRLKAPYKIDNTPIYRTGKDHTINGETKLNGSIVIADDISDPLELENVISHEKVHIDQIRRGDLTHDDVNYYWKGKKYPIEKIASTKNTPWEKEAYKKEKHKKHRR